MRQHAGIKNYQCELCGSSYVQKSTLTIHMRTHTNEKPFECKKCDAKFNQSHQLKNHMNAKHPEIKSKVVKQETFDTEMRITDQPVKKVEPIKSLPYICEICSKGFKVPSSLLAHIKIHSEERKYSCDQCNMKFKRREHLRIHVNGIHLKLKPFKCEKCDKAFAQSGDLKVHMKCHSGEKEFSCTVCNKKFRLLKALRTHLRIHTGEKPYSCSFCRLSFMTYMAMAAHTVKCQAEVSQEELLHPLKSDQMQVVESNKSNKITVITIPAIDHNVEKLQPITFPTNVVITLQPINTIQPRIIKNEN